MSLTDKLNEREALLGVSGRSSNKPKLHRKSFHTDRQRVALIGDTHIGSKFFKEDLLKERIDGCLENGHVVILMGDMIEAATRDSVGAGVYEQSEIIDEQVEHFYELFKPLAEEGRILGMHEGNHEARVYKQSGFDLAKAMARELGVNFFGYSQLHWLKVGNQSYTLYTTHGSSGSRMPHTKIKSALDLANVADVDIYAMGHVHTLDHHVRTSYAINKRKGTVEQVGKHFIITGSYLTHWGSYAHIKNMEPVPLGSPTLKLGGDKKEIRVSL